MNILIVGAGKVGTYLAQVLENSGDEVSIIDEHEENLALLENFSGHRVSGVAIDIDVLKSAGIENCDAVAAVTRNDNVNLMVSQIAQNIFKVPKVLCRVYDPARKDVFSSHFSIPTLCPTSITVDSVMSYLKFDIEPTTMQFGQNTTSFKKVPVTGKMIGSMASKVVKEDADLKLFAILDKDEKMSFYTKDVELKEGDNLILCEIEH